MHRSQLDRPGPRMRKARLPWMLAFGAVILTGLSTAVVSKAQDLSFKQNLVVATREVPPFAMKNDAGDWTGISIDLVRELKAELQSDAEHPIGLEFREMGLTQMLDAVELGEVDLAAAAITVNYEREKRFDFTHAFHSSGLGIAVGSSQRTSGWSGILQAVFSPTFIRIVAGLLAIMLISAVAMYLFERKRNREEFGGGTIRGIGTGLWWAAVTLTTVGYGDTVPKTVPGRLLGLLWMFAGLFIIASFTAAVTSALTVTQLKTRIAGPADLSHVKVATIDGSTSATYLRSRHIMFAKFTNVTDALQALKSGQADAVVYDAPILRYETYHHFPGEVFVLPITFERQEYAFAVPSGSPLLEKINQVILRTIGSPEWGDVLAGYLGESWER